MDKYLPILAIETSGDLCSICLYFGEGKYTEINLLDKHIHSEKLFSSIENVVGKGDQFKSIAVSIGPGSFTGLRIGLAAAKGMAAGKKIPLIPVPTLESFALQALPYIKEDESFAVANSVNRDEVYFAKFRKTGEKYKILVKPKLLENNLLGENVDAGELILGKYSSNDSNIPVVYSRALNVARWAYIFGKELVTYKYDYLEPYYLKNFMEKETK